MIQLTQKIRDLIEEAITDDEADGMITWDEYKAAVNWLAQFETDEEAL